MEEKSRYGLPPRLNWPVFFQRAWNRAIGKTIAAACAFALDYFVHVMDVLHFRMDCALRADFAAKAAGDAESFDDLDFHAIAHCEPPNALLGSGAQGRRRKSKTSSIGF